MRTLDERLAELQQVQLPMAEDFERLLLLAEDMADRITKLEDLLLTEQETVYHLRRS